jgi:hypothetical protein
MTPSIHSYLDNLCVACNLENINRWNYVLRGGVSLSLCWCVTLSYRVHDISTENGSGSSVVGPCHVDPVPRSSDSTAATQRQARLVAGNGLSSATHNCLWTPPPSVWLLWWAGWRVARERSLPLLLLAVGVRPFAPAQKTEEYMGWVGANEKRSVFHDGWSWGGRSELKIQATKLFPFGKARSWRMVQWIKFLGAIVPACSA